MCTLVSFQTIVIHVLTLFVHLAINNNRLCLTNGETDCELSLVYQFNSISDERVEQLESITEFVNYFKTIV